MLSVLVASSGSPFPSLPSEVKPVARNTLSLLHPIVRASNMRSSSMGALIQSPVCQGRSDPLASSHLRPPRGVPPCFPGRIGRPKKPAPLTHLYTGITLSTRGGFVKPSVYQGVEEPDVNFRGCHPERRRRVSIAQNRDSSLRLRSGQAGFAPNDIMWQ